MRNLLDIRNICITVILALQVVHSPSQAQSDDEIHSGVIRVKFESQFAGQFNMSNLINASDELAETGTPEVDDLNEDLGVTSFKRLFPFSPKHETKHRKHGLHLWYEIKFDPLTPPQSVVAKYQQLAGVMIAKPVYKKVMIEGAGDPVLFEPSEAKARIATQEYPFDDPFLPDQWHYQNYGDLQGIEDADIDLFEAWEIQTGNPDVIVSVVDGGIDPNHEDLRDNLWVNEAELNGEPGVDDDQNGYVDDINGYNFLFGGPISPGSHGTHVAGTVAAVNNNGTGVGGVAGGDGSGNGARLMSCMVYTDFGAGNGFAEAIVYGADNGAVVSQNSWGYTNPGYYEQEVLDAIDYFIAEAGNYEGSPMKGGLVFFAAGNSGQDELHYPGAYNATVAVASSDYDNLPAPYTNYGDWVDITAPGGNTIESLEGGVLSTLPGDQYGYLEGTSMACPHVSGVAALIISQFTKDSITPGDVIARIQGLSDPIPSNVSSAYDGKLGSGLLNAHTTLLINNLIKPETISDLRAGTVYHDSFEILWTVPDDEDDLKPFGFNVWFSTEELTEDNYESIDPFFFQNDKEAGETFSIEVGGTRPLTDYYFVVTSLDQWYNESDLSNFLHVRTASSPKFNFFPDSIIVNIDVTDSTVISREVTLENNGGGLLAWEAYVQNKYYTEEDHSAAARIASVSGVEKPTLQVNKFVDENGNVGYANPLGQRAEVMSVAFDPDTIPEKLEDITDFRSGLQHDPDVEPELFFGNNSTSVSFVHATRFEVPLDYEFNLTHVSGYLNIEDTSAPIIVEIRTGGSKPEEAEFYYAEEFYAEEGLGWQYFGFTRPLYFKDGDIFWVFMHHPKGDSHPVTANYVDDWPGYKFWVSETGGLDYEDLQTKLVFGWAALKVRALSAGDDPAFAYLDEVEGDIESGNQQQLNLFIDAETLRNGQHIANLGFGTNDMAYPYGTIALDVTVTGHQPNPVFYPELRIENAWVGQAKRAEISIENDGNGDLLITNIISSLLEFEPSYNSGDTIIIRAYETKEIVVNYTATSETVTEGVITMETNMGNLEVFATGLALEAPQLSLSTDTISSNMNAGESAAHSFYIKNEGKYVAQYSIPDLFDGTDNSKNSYQVFDSDMGVGVPADVFEDISAFGTSIKDLILGAYVTTAELGFNFPFYEGSYDQINIYADGVMAFGNITRTYPDTIPQQGTAQGAIAHFWHNLDAYDDGFDQIYGGDVYYASLGDRFIVQYDGVPSYASGDSGKVTFQTVLFKNGTIEMRYHDIEQTNFYHEAVVGIQNLDETKGIEYQSKDETDTLLRDGLLVRFVPLSNEPFLANLTPSSGALNPGDSVEVHFDIETSSQPLYDGTHVNNLFVFSEAIDSKVLTAEVNVTGVSDAEVNVNALTFPGDLIVGNTDTLSFMISNEGTKLFSVTDFNIDNPAFHLDVVAPLEVGPGAEIKLIVNFTPSAKGSNNGTLTITTNESEVFAITLSGNALSSPLPSLDRSSLTVNIESGSENTYPVTLSNLDTDTDLEYTIEFSGQLLAGIDDITYMINDTLTYGYGVRSDLDSPSSIQYYWEDIAQEENELSLGEDAYRRIALPFEFPFYGQLYDTLWLNQNGYMTVVEPEIATDPFYALFKKNDDVSGMIVPMWAWWTISESKDNSGFYFKSFSDHAVFQFESLRNYYPGMPGLATFQAILYQDGRIKFQYKDVVDYDGEFNYGLESPDEHDVVDLGRPEADWKVLFDYPFENEHAIVITPPKKGTVAPGQNASFDLKVKADNVLEGGPYPDTLRVWSNSTVTPLIEMPVDIHVTGKEGMLLSGDLDFGNMFIHPSLIYYDTITIENIGTKEIVVEELRPEGFTDVQIYSLDGEKKLSNGAGKLYNPIPVSPWEKVEIVLEIDPATVQDVQGVIKVATAELNDEMNFSGTIQTPPSISVPTEDYTANILATDSLTYPIEVINTGTTDLEYKIVTTFRPSDNLIIEDEAEEEEEVDPATLEYSDSLHYDFRDNGADLLRAPSSSIPHLYAVKMTAGESGLMITHIKAYMGIIFDEPHSFQVSIHEFIDPKDPNYWEQPEDSLRKINPEEGEILHQQLYTREIPLGEQWVYFEMEKPVIIDPNTDFFVILSMPEGFGTRFGIDFSSDLEILERMWGRHLGHSEYYSSVNEANWVFKIRALTESFKSSWLTSDIEEGVLPGGESITLNTIIKGEKALPGQNIGAINIVSNDPDNGREIVNFEVNVNAAPYFIYTPNQYGLPLEAPELETTTANLLATDLEGDAITISLEEEHTFVQLEQIGGNQAQLTVKPGYKDQGLSQVKVMLEDDQGNQRPKTIDIDVLNKNRTPIIDSLYYIVLNKYKDNVYYLKYEDVITDPDEDSLYYFYANYYPEIADVYYSDEGLVVVPKEVGVGLAVVGADDLQENGFAYNFFYIVVEDVITGIEGEKEFKVSVYPNPIIDEGNIELNLIQPGEVVINVVNLNGLPVDRIQRNFQHAGQQLIKYQADRLSSGVYLLNIKIDGEMVGTERILKK